MDRPTDRRTDEEQPILKARQREIADVAARLIAAKGFAQTGVRDVAAEINVSVATLYDYVRTKDEILVLIIERWAEIWRGGTHPVLEREKDPLRRLCSIIEVLVTATAENPHLTLLLYREQGSFAKAAPRLLKSRELERLELLAGVIQDGAAAGLIRTDVDPGFLAGAILLLIDGWHLKADQFAGATTPHSLSQSITETVVTGYGVLVSADPN